MPGALPNVCEIMLAAAQAGHMHIIEWAVTRDALKLGPSNFGLRSGKRQVLEWADARDLPRHPDSAVLAAQAGDFDTLRCARLCLPARHVCMHVLEPCIEIFIFYGVWCRILAAEKSTCGVMTWRA